MQTPPLTRYSATAAEDLLIARWWARMYADGDIERLFTRDGQTLASLLRIVGPPKLMFYAQDAEGIWFAAWFEQLFNSLVAGLWIRRDRRTSIGGLDAWLGVLEVGLKVSPTILGITKQEELLPGHRKLGYTVLGQVPGMWDGEPAWIVMLTREAFAKTLARYRRTAAMEATNGVGR